MCEAVEQYCGHLGGAEDAGRGSGARHTEYLACCRPLGSIRWRRPEDTVPSALCARLTMMTILANAVARMGDDPATGMARQSGRERRVNLDEKRRPDFGMIDAGAAFGKR
jgi:hypothetical protein